MIPSAIEILSSPFFSLVTLLLGFLIGHRLAIGRDRRKEFNAARDEFRKAFNQAIADINSDNSVFYNLMGSIDQKCYVAYLNFRHHLTGACRKEYDEAWKQYCEDYKDQSGFVNHSLRDKLVKDIEHLLEFPEYGLLRKMSFIYQQIWWRIRLIFFGPDNETKKLIEKFYNHDEHPKI